MKKEGETQRGGEKVSYTGECTQAVYGVWHCSGFDREVGKE